MAKARYKRHKQVRQEQAQLQKAAGKRGLWATIGSALIGGLATLVTGGTAAPIVAGLMAGVGSAAGGHLGNYLAGQTKGGKLAGGRFFQGSRADLSSQIKEGIWTKAATAAIMAGAKQLGGKTKLSTTGDKLTTTVTDVGGTATKTATGEVAKSGFKLGDIFKRRVGAETAGATYATEAGGLKGAMAHLGKTIDIKGSTLGKGVGKLTGAYQPDVGWVTGADIGADLKNVLPTELHTATGVTGDLTSDLKNYQFGPTTPAEYRTKASQLASDPLESIELGSIRGREDAFKSSDYISDVSKIDAPEMTFWKRRNQNRLTSRELLQKQKTEKLWDWEKSPEGPDFIGPREIVDPIESAQLRDMGQKPGDMSSYLDTGMADVPPQIPGVEGGPAVGVRGTGLSAEEWYMKDKVESGEGFIEGGKLHLSPERPNVPIASEDTFFTEQVGDIQGTDFSEFEDWEDPVSLKETYWGSGTPAVEELLGSETGTGLKYHQYQPQADTNFGLQSSDYDLLAPSRKRVSDLQRSLKTGKRLNLYPRLFPGD